MVTLKIYFKGGKIYTEQFNDYDTAVLTEDRLWDIFGDAVDNIIVDHSEM